jgi:pSer/pThr/pTyr-binding forkhead associated (FHA) protein
MWLLRPDAADANGRILRVADGAVKTIGRMAPADFILDEALISRVHCRLTATNDELAVEDLESTNGTFVNGRRIDRSLLVAGDRLRLGRVELEVAWE